MLRHRRLIIFSALAVVVVWCGLTLAVNAQPSATNFGLDNLSNVQIGRQPLVDTISSIVNIVLGILGIVAFLIVLYGGFLWMSSRGEQKQIDKAKRVIIDGVIGLAIVLASWAIAAFVMNFLGRSTDIIGNNGGGDDPGGGSPAERYLVVTDFYPDAINNANAPKNSVIIATFNQNLNCATVTPESVVLSQGGTPLANVHLRCSGRSLTIRSGTSCPPPLDQFPIPLAQPNVCGSVPPITQCLGVDATPSNPQCQPAVPNPSASISQCPGLRGCGCFTSGSYTLLLKSDQAGAHIEGTRAGRNQLQRDTSLDFSLSNDLDTVAPRIASVSPVADPAQTVPRNRNITVTFTKAVDPSSITVYNANPADANQVSDVSLATLVFRTASGPVNGRITGLTTRSVRWKPTDVCGGSAPATCGCMPADATITVEVHDGLTGIHGASCLALDTSTGPAGMTCVENDKCTYTFRTNGSVDLTPPQLDTNNVYPTSGEINADRALIVGAPWAGHVLASLTDDSGIAADSVDMTTFLMANDVPTRSVGQYSATQFGLQPGTDVLSPNHTFWPSLYGWGGLCSDDVGGIQDNAGNALAGRARWQFRTGNSVNGGNPLITRISPNTGPRGQCVTILGYNLGCTTVAGSVDGPAQANRWSNSTCSVAAVTGKIQVTGSGNNLVDVPAGDIISWDEINRPETVPPNYSPQNQILITVPTAAATGDVVVSPAYNP